MQAVLFEDQSTATRNQPSGLERVGTTRDGGYCRLSVSSSCVGPARDGLAGNETLANGEEGALSRYTDKKWGKAQNAEKQSLLFGIRGKNLRVVA